MNKISDLKRGECFEVWKKAYGQNDPQFIERLQAQGPIWKALQKILDDLYQSKHSEEFKFDDRAFIEKMIWTEGYKRALQDIYRLLPDQGVKL